MAINQPVHKKSNRSASKSSDSLKAVLQGLKHDAQLAKKGKNPLALRGYI